jgi:hypothetical protein
MSSSPKHQPQPAFVTSTMAKKPRNTSRHKQIDPLKMPTNLQPTCRVQLEIIGNMVMLPFSKSATTKMAKRAAVSGLNSI